jgi:fructose-1-phosphate kinase PfkB-like protein
MVLVVAPNPSLDKTITLPGFEPGLIFRPSQILTLAGGKGFNFARALHTLGYPALVLAPVGGYQGQYLVELAGQERLNCHIQPIQGEMRTCLTVIDPLTGYFAYPDMQSSQQGR